MFNFFEEIKKEYVLNNALFNSFNIINMSNRLLYVEGHKGVVLIAENNIAFKISKGVISVKGENLALKKISLSTLVIEGKITMVEHT